MKKHTKKRLFLLEKERYDPETAEWYNKIHDALFPIANAAKVKNISMRDLKTLMMEVANDVTTDKLI